MIVIKLNINAGEKLNKEQEDAFRHHLRHSALQWVFAMSDTFGHQTGLQFTHKDVDVSGEILLEEQPAQPAQG